MSHNKERTGKNCLNCRIVVAGRYCQPCDQEHVVSDHTFSGLVTRFFSDITQFDGMFVSTDSRLISRPGNFSPEDLKCRRAKIPDPAWGYLFTSSLFFYFLNDIFLHVSKKGEGKISTVNHGTSLVHNCIRPFLWVILYFWIDELYFRFPLTILKWLKGPLICG